MIFYHRPDGAKMIEVAPHQFVNETSALALGLIARAAISSHKRANQEK
jgi:hypothetical protein